VTSYYRSKRLNCKMSNLTQIFEGLVTNRSCNNWSRPTAYMPWLPKAHLLGYAAGKRRIRGKIASLKPTRVTLFTMILYKSEKSIRDKRPFCHPLLCRSSAVKYTFTSLTVVNPRMRLDYQKSLKSPPLNLLFTDWIRPCRRPTCRSAVKIRFKT